MPIIENILTRGTNEDETFKNIYFLSKKKMFIGHNNYILFKHCFRL